MPVRKIPLVTGSIYHIVNRGVASMSIFLDKTHYQHSLETLLYYQKNPKVRFSYFARQQFLEKNKLKVKLQKKLVKIIGYCLMSNHFHLLLEQSVDNGISDFMRKFSNSYTRYFNTKNKRIGPIFQGNFKSVLIETEELLLHVLRYIHLNPYSANIVANLNELKHYQYSSLPEYFGLTKTDYCHKDTILSYFKSNRSFQSFVFDNSDSQRSLSKIKPLLLDHTPGV